MYEILIAPIVKKELDKLDDFEKNRIIKKLQILKEDPFPYIKKLYSGELWVLKVGRSDFRIILWINKREKIINIIAIGRRKSVYKRLKRKLSE